MKNEPDQTVLQVNADPAFTSVVNAFAENSALTLGLRNPETLELTLAAEEVFTYLCNVVLPEGGLVGIRCFGGGYYVQIDFTFPAAEFDMRAFNITATVSLSEEAEFEQMGLLLASRSVDRFKVTRDPAQGMKLTLIKEKVYPAVEAGAPLQIKPLEKFSVRAPVSEELKLFVQQVERFYSNQTLPNFLKFPGKLVDMVGGGELLSAIAIGTSGEIGGGVFWQWIGDKAVECFGPYLFNQGEDSSMSGTLLDSCIGAIAKTQAVVLINRFPTKEFPRKQFEYLGDFVEYAGDAPGSSRDAWVRLLQEDTGCVVWLHPQLDAFAEKEYTRLVLPREIRRVTDQGEQRAPHSVLLTAFDRFANSVWIEPVLYGLDFESNLSQHLDLFQREGIPNVFFQMDLGQAWQADFALGLLQNGFAPALILPYAGTADQIVFQLKRTGP